MNWMPILLLAMTAANPIWVGKFTGAGAPPAPWKLVPYNETKPTSYHQAMIKGVPAIEARVDDSMALLARPIAVDLANTPILCWRWLVDGPVAKGDMRRKGGDDYAARVYVGFAMPNDALSAATRFKLSMARKMLGRALPDAAVTYVWDNRHPVGTAQRSSYTDRSQLVVAETGGSRAGTWVVERANVAADFARAFGGKPGKPTQIAIAADGDNTNSKGRAAFADLHFVKSEAKCNFP